jgi:hypothetical protein
MSYKIAGIDVTQESADGGGDRCAYAGVRTGAATIYNDAERVAPTINLPGGAGGEEVVMESTAQYGRSVWLELEPRRLHAENSANANIPARVRKLKLIDSVGHEWRWHCNPFPKYRSSEGLVRQPLLSQGA